jgi:membrane associated rhomboid family serine protease
MGEAERNHINDRRQPNRRNRFLLGATDNALVALLSINAMFFLVLMVVQVGMYAGLNTPEYFAEHVLQWFQMPAGLVKLSTRPWTFLTYMFTETGDTLFNGIGNMVWLWAFGYILQSVTGNSKLIPIYIYGGVCGAIFFILAHYLIAPIAGQREFAGLMGANASVIAVATATTTLVPGHRFFAQIRGGIPIWVLLAVYLLIDFAGIAGSGAAYSLAHLGGALAGYLFVYFMRKGKDGSIWMNKFYYKVIHLFDPKKPSASNSANDLFYDAGSREPFTKTTNLTQKRVDEILDKINLKGYHFLTDEEKDFLRKASDTDEI